MKNYTACYRCGQPQRICKVWEREMMSARECEFKDLVMPAIWALWGDGGSERKWLKDRLEVEVNSAEETLVAAARPTSFGGTDCILGVKVLGAMLERWRGANN